MAPPDRRLARDPEEVAEDAEVTHESGRPGPAVDGYVNVCEYECETCIFRKGNRMQLNSGRVRGMIDAAIAEDVAITCHGTIFWPEGEELAVCRGFFDRHAQDTMPLRLAQMCDRVRFIKPPAPPSGMLYQQEERDDE